MAADNKHLISKQAVAYMLGVNVRTIETWQQKTPDPLPYIPPEKNGLANRYDPQAVVAWHVRQEVDKLIGETPGGELVNLDKERARLAAAQADGHELKNAVTRRELAPVQLLQFALNDIAEQINSIFESIPLKIKNRVPNLKATEVEIIKREIVKAQNAASKVQLNFDALEGSD